MDTNANTNVSIEREIDVEDNKLVLTQKVSGQEFGRLVFHPERCSGCRICIYACPVNAIEFTSYEMLKAGMPLVVDHTKCCFCGLCYAFCPDRAFEFYRDSASKPHLLGGAKKLDSCVGCRVCSEVCPVSAIELKVKTIDSFHERRIEGKKGELRIDPEKCKLCGRCTLFCDALVAVFSEKIPAEILIREERCDYCGLCEVVCPNGAIEVKSEDKLGDDVRRAVKTAELVSVSISECIECKLCEIFCPYEGVVVERSFEGEIKVDWKRLERVCDLESCRACIEVCRSKAWYVEEGKLRLDERLCRFCRACMYACPENLIEVRLSEIKADVEWEGWKESIRRILGEKIARVEREWMLERKERKTEMKTEIEKVAKEEPVESERVKKLLKVLKNPSYRRLFELNPEKFRSVFEGNKR